MESDDLYPTKVLPKGCDWREQGYLKGLRPITKERNLMKIKDLKQAQTGFTLIELVVVIVILGIIAATAVPKFASLTDDANQAVAQGIVGAIISSAVIQLGSATGVAQPFDTIIDATDFSNVPATTAVAAGAGMSGTAYDISGSLVTAGTLTCDASVDSSFTVTVGTLSSTGTLSSGLCSS